MSEKPQKRLVTHSNAGRDKMPPTPTQLVSKGKYVLLLGRSVSLTFLGMSSYLISIFLLLVLVVEFWYMSLEIPYWAHVVSVLATAGLSVIFFLAGRRLSRKANEIEHVKPITLHTAHLLPAKDTLVRASDLQPIPPQAELLRVAQYGKETPAEELLRATQENSQDV